MNVKVIQGGVAVTVAFFLGTTTATAQEATPKRYFLDFTETTLVHVPSTTTLQISTESMVLSYGGDWEIKQLKPYLYHLRLKTWKGFYWKVNTSRKEAYKIEGGSFGSFGGNETRLTSIKVDVVGGDSGDAKPERFFLRCSPSYLVHDPNTGTKQIIADGMVLSYGGDWEIKQLKPYLYHLRLKTWKGFYWKVNTSRKEAYKIEGGTFGTLGGEETKLQMAVRVVQ
jgi:hypothetical protein